MSIDDYGHFRYEFNLFLERVASSHSSLDWLGSVYPERIPYDAVSALEQHIKCLDSKYDASLIKVAEKAIDEIHEYMEADKGCERWDPSREDIIEVCGIWYYPVPKLTLRVYPSDLLRWSSKSEIIKSLVSEGGIKVEPIPEKLVPEE